MTHFVRIELAYPHGWWKAAEHAQLSDPAKYASTLLARPGPNKGAVIGVRITDHDSDQVWAAGQEPDADRAIGGVVEPPAGATAEPELTWEDVL